MEDQKPLGWASGMLNKNGRGRRRALSSPKVDRDGAEDSLVQLRWHLDVPKSSESARAVSSHICASVLAGIRASPGAGGGGGKGAGAAAGAPQARASIIPFSADLEQPEGGRRRRRMPQAKKFLDVGTGMRLRWEEWGEGLAPVLLLLHDVGDTAQMWRPLAEELGQDFRVLAYDLRGHGDSTWSSAQQYDLESHVQDLHSLVLEMDLYTQPLIMAGIGLGAAIALTYASAQPQLVGAAILMEFPPKKSAWERLEFFYGQAASFNSLEEAVAFECAGCWGEAPLSAAHARARLRYFLEEDSRQWRYKMDPGFFCRCSADDLMEAARDCQCPVLLAWGAKSGWTGAAEIRQLSRAVGLSAGVTTAEVPQANHGSLLQTMAGDGLEQSDCLHALLTFLKRQEAELYVEREGDPDARLPEKLGLRPLPQYATLEEAQKALGAKKVPTRALMEVLLEELGGDDESIEGEKDY